MTTTHESAGMSKGLLSRLLGVIFSPRDTYADIAAHPKVMGALLTVTLIIAAVNFAFLSTDIGQRAMVDQQIAGMESFGFKVTDQMIENMDRGAPRGKYFSLVGIFVFIPIVMALMAGIALVVFNAIMGGEASFKQVLAIIVHSGVIGALQVLFVTPMNYLRETMASATSLGVFFPMVDSMSFAGMLLGSLDIFRIWSLVSLAIGLGVLYKKRTSPIATSFILVYLVIMLVVAGVRTALSGA